MIVIFIVYVGLVSFLVWMINLVLIPIFAKRFFDFSVPLAWTKRVIWKGSPMASSLSIKLGGNLCSPLSLYIGCLESDDT